MNRLIPLLLICVIPSAWAAETDNFTGRYTEIAQLPDVLPALDQFTNHRLEQAIADSNQGGSCDPRLLYLSVWNALGKNPIGEVERFAEDPRNIKNYLVDFKNGIYGDVPTFIEEHRKPRFADLFILTGWFDSTIRLNGQIIGIDKLGHFFGQGWEYFQAGNLKDAFELEISRKEGWMDSSARAFTPMETWPRTSRAFDSGVISWEPITPT